MKIQTLKLTLLLACILISATSCSQRIKSFSPEQIGPGSLINKVYLYNKTDVKISFNISLDRNYWQAESLKPLHDVIFISDIYASIGTENEQITYLLKKGDSYFITWDKDERKYVIMRRKTDDAD